VFAADINSRLSNGSIARAMAADVSVDPLLRFDFSDPKTSMSPPFQNKHKAHWKSVDAGFVNNPHK